MQPENPSAARKNERSVKREAVKVTPNLVEPPPVIEKPPCGRGIQT